MICWAALVEDNTSDGVSWMETGSCRELESRVMVRGTWIGI